ncbi:MAG TPA: hypothetical protein VEA41_16540 [Salinarimonas sp.]|jgi:hypothetical protein|nr:hypothetical protein [Salinarimonas sp.]
MKRPFLLLLCVLVLAGCAYAPRGIEGVSSDDRWVALPLRGWLAEDRGRPEALIACLSADCPHKLMVALVTLQGDDARAAVAMLREPGRLAADLQARDARRERRRARARVELRSVGTGAVPGFAVVLAPEDGRRAPAHGAAFGRLEGGTLSLVLAIGDDAGATLAAAREAAAARLGP